MQSIYLCIVEIECRVGDAPQTLESRDQRKLPRDWVYSVVVWKHLLFNLIAKIIIALIFFKKKKNREKKERKRKKKKRKRENRERYYE